MEKQSNSRAFSGRKQGFSIRARSAALRAAKQRTVSGASLSTGNDLDEWLEAESEVLEQESIRPEELEIRRQTARQRTRKEKPRTRIPDEKIPDEKRRRP